MEIQIWGAQSHLLNGICLKQMIKFRGHFSTSGQRQFSIRLLFFAKNSIFPQNFITVLQEEGKKQGFKGR